MFDFQEHGRYFAQFPDGAEAVATADLVALGAENVEPGYRGVYFNAERDALYRIVYRTLTVTRVLAPLVHFQCHTPEYLYKKVRSIDWSAMIGTDQTFAVFATVSNSAIRHSQYAALTVKDAVVDQFRERAGSRPNVDTTDPDLWINLYLHANRATLSLDASGGSMHRRGYRVESVEAPMQETVAAAMVAMSEWDGETPLIDPMCGSGTLLCEALMRYARVPSGYLRARFGVERFPDFDAALWKHQRADADAGIRHLDRGLISGSDSDPAAARAARTNLSRLPAGVNVRVERRRFEDIEQIKGVTILTNPPYGVRAALASNCSELCDDTVVGRDTLPAGGRAWIRSDRTSASLSERCGEISPSPASRSSFSALASVPRQRSSRSSTRCCSSLSPTSNRRGSWRSRASFVRTLRLA
jgi:putative N6-adenine-specific DNA methylase